MTQDKSASRYRRLTELLAAIGDGPIGGTFKTGSLSISVLEAEELRAEIRAILSERGRNDELPLSCEVEHDAIVIRVGAKAIAHATNINPALYDAESDCGQFRVSDPAAFAKEVHRELVREQEDGSTPLTRVLDQAVYEAINQGAEGVEEARPYERPE